MVLEDLRQWRRRQLASLRDSNQVLGPSAADRRLARTQAGPGAAAEPGLIARILPGDESTDTSPRVGAAPAGGDDGGDSRGSSVSGSGDGTAVVREGGAPVATRPEPGSLTDVRQDAAEANSRGFGQRGKPLNRQSPFYVGFVGAIGVLLAYALWGAIGQMGNVFTLLLVAMFLTLALDPIVQFLTRRGMGRGWAVAIVFFGLVAVFVGVGLIVVPPVAQQSSALTGSAPQYFTDLLAKKWVRNLDAHYHVVTNLQNEVQKRLSDQSFLTGVFGGVLGAGRAVVSGFFAFFTVLVLTLYFLGALPSVKRAAYAIVPATRRERVSSLTEEVFRRVGSYAIGQVAIASANAFMSFIMMSIVDIPYPAVLAVAVGFLGLVPMVGAGLGATVVCTVAIFDEPHKAVIALVYYVVYQQIENYVIVPRIMQRTVSVPGAVTIVAALAGGTLLGMLGALLAIPVAAGLLLLYEEVLIPRQRHY